MAIYKRFSTTIWSAFSIVIMMGIWLAFAPKQVGGLASYIIVIGNSMEPKFHIGDLIIVHEQPVYQVGDAIVYQNVQLKKFVFHRIVSQQLGHYTLQGDNNSWLDTYKPTQEEVIGKLWLHIPRGGKFIQKVRSPFVMALVAGALGAILAIRVSRSKARGSKNMSNQTIQEWFRSIQHRVQSWFITTDSSKPRKSLGFEQAEILEGSFFALGAIALSSLILAIIVFSRPTFRVVQDDLSYQHLGIFSYSASAPQGIYDQNSIKSGDPVFTKLTCSLDVNFQYTLIAAQAENITGTYQLTAIISEQVSGWQRVVPLQDETAFSGNTFGTSARLDLCKISSLAQSMEAGTDFHPGTYTLAITPHVKLAGNLSDHTLESIFDTGPVFRHDRVQFSLIREDEKSNPLVLNETGLLQETRLETNTLLFVGREFSIPALRWIALLGIIISIGGLALLGLKFSHLNQENFFRIKYSSIMIEVQNALNSPNIIDVRSMDDLAKLAERFNVMILHSMTNNQHTYALQAGEVTYRFMLDLDKTVSTVLKEDTINAGGGG